MTPTLSQSGNARDGLMLSDDQLDRLERPVRVYATANRNRDIPLERTRDTRQPFLLALLTDLFGGK